MGHYDSSRPGYCAGCGAAPGNMLVDGTCPFCSSRTNSVERTLRAVKAPPRDEPAAPAPDATRRALSPAAAWPFPTVTLGAVERAVTLRTRLASIPYLKITEPKDPLDNIRLINESLAVIDGLLKHIADTGR